MKWANVEKTLDVVGRVDVVGKVGCGQEFVGNVDVVVGLMWWEEFMLTAGLMLWEELMWQEWLMSWEGMKL